MVMSQARVSVEWLFDDITSNLLQVRIVEITSEDRQKQPLEVFLEI